MQLLNLVVLGTMAHVNHSRRMPVSKSSFAVRREVVQSSEMELFQARQLSENRNGLAFSFSDEWRVARREIHSCVCD